MDRDYGPRFSLSELVEATGASKRTVRFYIKEALMPAAEGKGRYSYYTSEHVEALTRIRELRDRNLSLDEIREVLRVERSPGPDPTPEGEPWIRIVLHPDVELHLKSGAPEHIHAFSRQVQDFAAQWFGNVPADNSPDTWTPEE